MPAPSPRRAPARRPPGAPAISLLPAIEPLGQLQPLGHILAGEGKGCDLAPLAPAAAALLQVGLKSPCALVAVLRRLGQQLHDEPRDPKGHARREIRRGQGLPRDLGMDQLQGVVDLEWWLAGQSS